MSTLVLVASALIAGGLILAWVQFSWRRPDLSALAVLFITLVSAHVLALAFRAGAPSEVVRGLIPLKDVLAVVLVMVLATRAIRLHRWSRSLTLVVVLFVVVGGLGSVGLAGWPTSDVVLSARNVTVAVVGLLTGLLLTDRE